jgi:hypothetical protein
MVREDGVLVATSNCLLLVDIQTGRTETLSDRYGLYYGITWDHELVYVAARWYPWYTLSARVERPRLLVFDKHLRLVERRKYPYPAGGMHQILFHDGHIYCSCSREDSYLVWNGEKWSQWFPSDDSSHHGKDTHHFNSAWFEGDRMFIVGHNNGPSDVWELSRPDQQVIRKYRVGKYIHNAWREGDTIAVCNSGEGRVETVDGDVLAETGDFPRGVAIGSNVNLVGISTLATRRLRAKTRGKVQVYSKTWELLDTLDLGRCGQVCELRRLDGDDLAHNGLAFPGLSSGV